jgi:hypothetical protein
METPSSRKLRKVGFYSLLAPVVFFAASFFTGGFGPCGSMAGFYCLYGMLFSGAVAPLLFFASSAKYLVERIP